MPLIDDLSLAILIELQADARQTNAKIAKKLQCAQSTVSKKIRQLVKDGVITSFTCSVNINGTNADFIQFALVELKDYRAARAFVTNVKKRFTEVVELHLLEEDKGCLLKIITSNRGNFYKFTLKLGAIPNVKNVTSLGFISTFIQRGPDLNKTFGKRETG
jgi:Lrp/AsnC family leucine-responsive transcriptional regulator